MLGAVGLGDGFEFQRYRLSYSLVADDIGFGPAASGAAANPACGGVASAPRVVEVGGCESFATQDLLLFASFDGEVLSFSAEALVPVLVESFQVELGHRFAPNEQVLLNGYQSWTTTTWAPARACEHGLDHLPRPLLERYAIDGIGDYRFAEYGKRPGRRHGYTYAAFRTGTAFHLLASLDEKRGFTCIKTDVPLNRVMLQPECPVVPLQPGQRVPLGSFALLQAAEPEAYDRWFCLSGVKARPVQPLVGYSSWYRHYGDIDQAKLEADLAGACKAFSGADVAGAQRLFQIDDGFCRVGDWRDVDAGKFPAGLAPLAARIREAGFLPGLWMAPFVCERESRLFARHPEWLLRDAKGNPVRTGPHWSGAYALDTRNPQVRQHVRDSVSTAVHEWGFGLLKLDFLYAACLLPHDGLNRGGLMADAMALLREAAGENALLLGCGVPLASAFGVVDYCRIGCDVGLDWDDKPPMRLLHHERVSTKNSLANTLARAPLDGRAFGNDPDVFFLRDDVRLSAARRQRLLEADAAYGSVLLTSDDMGQWDAGNRDSFRRAVRTLLQRK